jgi:hypothetical protein
MVDTSASLEVAGTASCAWAGFGATMWPGGHDAVVTGMVDSDAMGSGDIVNTGAEVGTLAGTWTGCWIDGVLQASFNDTLDLEYGGITYPVSFDGSFTATLE